ncbi:iron dicitrate transport regulator FecR [Novosphingobium guangzhouense]|uniref:Iron dicitrate transport regulator FecR n=2 Tax=Novosphingobium guangzhouense TaxID=1850347 RepID=A0A2K2G0A1_9SPHN|nr:iron dicitrate transport regulator FecR [Novosphingobium guangzhouense]
MASDNVIRDEALGWTVRVGDPAFADWEAFTLWLEADPAHARAYDEVAASVADAAQLVVAVAPANDDLKPDEADEAPPRRRRPWLASAIAASLAVVAGFWAFQGQQRDFYTVETALGETRRVTLDADTHIELAGGTAVRFDRKDKRYAQLDHGQALFTVRHDAAHPFEVTVGKERLVDIGTVFDVRHDAQGLSVAVSEGAVQFDPDGADVRVSPGEVLRRAAGAGEYTLTRLPAEQVGEWREGRLTFESASLEDVAAQLKRATGIEYVASPGGSGTVSGSILVAPLRKDPASLGALLGLSVRSENGHWVIGSR